MHDQLTEFIRQYGYWALFIGTLAEGETITILAGIAAQQKWLHYGWAVIIAALGAILGDQILYYIGRRYGTSVLKRFTRYQDKIDKANALIHRRPTLFVVGVRFMYGLRLIGPVIIGNSRLAPGRFFWLNVGGAIFWAVIFVTLGYIGGEAANRWMQQFDQNLEYLLWLAAAIIIGWGGYLILRRWLKKR